MIATQCPNCKAELEEHQATDLSNSRPTPGDVSICFGCHHIGVYDENLAIREPTDEEFREIADVKGLFPLLRLLAELKKGREP